MVTRYPQSPKPQPADIISCVISEILLNLRCFLVILPSKHSLQSVFIVVFIPFPRFSRIFSMFACQNTNFFEISFAKLSHFLHPTAIFEKILHVHSSHPESVFLSMFHRATTCPRKARQSLWWLLLFSERQLLSFCFHLIAYLFESISTKVLFTRD